jgi:hypothetical protein
MRAILSKSGSKCAAKVVALSQPKDRAFYLNSTHINKIKILVSAPAAAAAAAAPPDRYI